MFCTDRYVVIGNHRDAWGFGGLDPNIGTSIMMEMSRVIGQMLKKGNHGVMVEKKCTGVQTLKEGDSLIEMFREEMSGIVRLIMKQGSFGLMV